MSIAIFGSINIDLTTYGERLPAPGETLHGDLYAIGLGGKGCNQAAAVRKLGAETTLIGRIGQDSFGHTALEALKQLDISTHGVHSDPDNNTGIAVIGVDGRAENCITVIGGANMALDETDVARQKSALEAADILLLQMEVPLEAALCAADLARAGGGTVIFDPAPAPAHGLPKDVLERVDIITPNESETQLLTGIKPSDATEAAEAAKILRDKGVAMAIIKLGANGVYFESDDERGFVTPFTVDSIDSVAAGDCFNGGLAYALSRDMSLTEAVRFAAACGALSTTKSGASSSAPSLEEVENLLKSQ